MMQPMKDNPAVHAVRHQPTRGHHPKGTRLAMLLAVSLLLTGSFGLGLMRAQADSDLAGYQQTNLASDIPGLAAFTDPHLINPWGISFGPTTPFWISDNGAGVTTLYSGAGQPFPPASPLVVTIPPPMGSPTGTVSTPTGQVFNSTTDFVVSAGGHSGASRFIFATEDGTISGWNPTVDATHAITGVDNSPSGAIYKGLALGSAQGSNFLYAANFHAGTIDVFDGSFHPAQLAGSFTDSAIKRGYAPFNIQNLGGQLFVTYALQDADGKDDVAGPAHGFVDIFSTDGQLVRRFATHGTLNSPWGLTLDPTGSMVLVGNFGDGRINVFDLASGDFLGQLRDTSNRKITISGLWALSYGNGGPGFDQTSLYFTAGLDDEAHGLFGKLTR